MKGVLGFTYFRCITYRRISIVDTLRHINRLIDIEDAKVAPGHVPREACTASASVPIT